MSTRCRCCSCALYAHCATRPRTPRSIPSSSGCCCCRSRGSPPACRTPADQNTGRSEHRLRVRADTRVAAACVGCRGYRRRMGRAGDDATLTLAIDVCPVCASSEVRIAEEWFVLEFDRGDELRHGHMGAAPQFGCRASGADWSRRSITPGHAALVRVPRETPPVSLGELHHEVGRLAIQAEAVARKIELALRRPDLLVALGRQDLHRI